MAKSCVPPPLPPSCSSLFLIVVKKCLNLCPLLMMNNFIIRVREQFQRHIPHFLICSLTFLSTESESVTLLHSLLA